ncbi:MAG: hypothetical protein GY944_24470 [bacterium]|nr:hypothetical protein [bacterium]
MATVRTLAYLLTKLPTSPGAITAETMRDCLVTQARGHAMVHIATGDTAATTLVLDTPTQAAGTTTLSTVAIDGLTRWSMPSDNRLLLTVAEDRLVEVDVSISMSAATSGQQGHLHIAMGASGSAAVVASTEIQRKVAGGSDVGSTSLSWVGIMSSGDVIEIWLENKTASVDMTLERLAMSVKDGIA